MNLTAMLFMHVISILVHACDKTNNGGCSQICNKKNETYKCSCNSGFVLGKDGKSCNEGLI